MTNSGAQDEELKAQLLQDNDEFRRLCAEHDDLKHQVEKLEAKPFLTEAEEMEEQRLKKLKLHIKDNMTGLILQAKHAVAG